jgi:hypothetical protein
MLKDSMKVTANREKGKRERGNVDQRGSRDGRCIRCVLGFANRADHANRAIDY